MTNKELLKAYSAYLPYGVKVIMEGKQCNIAYLSTKRIAVIRSNSIGEVKKIKWEYVKLNVKLILRPLSDLTKEIEHNGEKFVPVERIEEIYGLNSMWIGWDGVDEGMGHFEHQIIQKLLEWHFDTEGLIEKGYAIDINTLKK